MTNIIERAGLKPWPKLFQNLRSTRATELMDHFTASQVAEWMGHSIKIGQKHYHQCTDEHYEAASKFTASVTAANPRNGVKRVETA